MPFNISNFRSELQYDGARANLFEVTMQFPILLGNSDAARKLTFMCKSASLPGVSVGTVPMYYFGRELKFAGNKNFQDWSITIINDEDFLVRNAFEEWSDGINRHVENLRTLGNNPNSYQVDMQVVQYGKSGNGIKGYNLVGCWPTDISTIDLDWGTNDTIEDFTVTLAYQWWEAYGPSGVQITDGESSPVVLP
jgi:hypothetical protein